MFLELCASRTSFWHLIPDIKFVNIWVLLLPILFYYTVCDSIKSLIYKMICNPSMFSIFLLLLKLMVLSLSKAMLYKWTIRYQWKRLIVNYKWKSISTLINKLKKLIFHFFCYFIMHINALNEKLFHVA